MDTVRTRADKPIAAVISLVRDSPKPGLGVPPVAWLALAAIFLVWGSSFLAIRVAVQHVPPFLLAGSRFVAAAAVLFVLAGIREHPSLPSIADLRRYALTGLAMYLGANGLLTYGIQHVPTGIAAVIVATIPLWMVAVEVVGRRLQPTALIAMGVLGGVLGVAILAGPMSAQPVDVLGAGAIVLAAACWAVGSLSARHEAPRHGPLTVVTIQMATGGLALLAVAVLSGEIARTTVGLIPAEAWVALAWLILPAGVLTGASYTYALRVWPAPVVAIYPFANAVVAVILGSVVLNEPVTNNMLLGSVVVLASAGVIAIQRTSRRGVAITR